MPKVDASFLGPLILNCFTTCRVTGIVNTGTTTETLTFIDCSGNTVSESFEPQESAIINFCSLFPITGNTSNFERDEIVKPNAIYFLSSCCIDNQYITIFANDDYLNLDDSVYCDNYVPSSSSGETYDGCFYVYDKKSIKIGQQPNYYPIFKNPKVFGDFGCESCVENNPCDTDCYEISSCDGTVPTFTSTNPIFSGYVDNSLLITITDPLPIPEKCYEVKYIGVQSCVETYGFEINQEEVCSCSVPITIEPRNECDVLTIFPMEVECLVTHPSTYNSFDGAATLIITGGTSPYTIIWSTGSITPLIYNLNAGNYNATVIDFYGDFTANTTCVLTAETQTTTTTTTTKPIPVYGDLCMTIKRKGSSKSQSVIFNQIQFEPYNITNGTQSWLSDNNTYFMYFSTGTTNQWVVSGSSVFGGIINNNPAPPPLIGWQALGDPSIISITVTTGTCLSYKEITANITKNDLICETKGSITIQGFGGVPPYQYSINNGTTFSTLSTFSNLNAGSYIVIVKDSLGNQSTPSLVTLTQTNPEIFVLTLTLDDNLNTFQIQPSNNLAPNQTITFSIEQYSQLNYYPVNITPAPTLDNVFTFNGGLGDMGVPTITNSQPALNINCIIPVLIQNQQIKVYTRQLTISGGQTITGSYTDIINNLPVGLCRSANRTFNLYLVGKPTVNNCKCCDVKVVNPIKPN